jgi:asparagine synthase (glutamine-hydrolysing)
MNDSLFHRGPDDAGTLLRPGVGLAMRRLSIIDRSGGHQPLSNEDGSLWIVFNGEIYNFAEIRRSLEASGHHFVTTSDTEVIVHAYEEFGEKCLHLFNGMFAFTLWDANAGEIFIARDRLGVKPLYYSELDGTFYFASEIKALMKVPELGRTIDPEALDDVLTYRHVQAPRTIFKSVRALLPGHFLKVGARGIRSERYWNLPHPSKPGNWTEEEAKERLRSLLEDSVRLRLISEVPLGAFLSGGLDSSTVVALMSRMMNKPVKTFTVGFEGIDSGKNENRYDERRYARVISEHFHTEHHEVVMSPNGAELLPRLAWFLDEPLADAAVIPTYLMSDFARKHVTVALAGEGADELFGGYPKYRLEKLADRLHRLGAGKWLRLLNRLPGQFPYAGALRKIALHAPGRWVAWDRICTPDLRAELVRNGKAEIGTGDDETKILSYLPKERPEDSLANLIYLDLQIRLPNDLLMKVDKMSMAVSLEARVPFLDYRIVEFACELPTSLKVGLYAGKRILRRAMSDLLPENILRRPKHGFSVPVSSWLRRELRPFIEEVLNDASIENGKVFDPRTIRRILDEHQSGQRDHGQLLWTILNIELWRKAYGAGL